MFSLQRNISKPEVRSPVYDALSVWNEFLSRGIRDKLNSTLWTVALVYGFFKQLSEYGRDFRLTLIARRSHHYAGTRYLKRGVNEKGHVANDVETEQIVFEDVPDGSPYITLLRNGQNYAVTKHHFNNLVYRYGSPIIILDLVKAFEKKPQESILLVEFGHAIDVINRDLTEEDRLRFLHFDLSEHSKRKAKTALDSLKIVADNALDMTGFLFCLLCYATLSMMSQRLLISSLPPAVAEVMVMVILQRTFTDRYSDKQIGENSHVVGLDITRYRNPLMLQQGVLRTNCIDCLDRTNIAQFCYGLVALGHQLHAISFIETPNIDFNSPLTYDLTKLYEAMGDALAIQYGGSEAHNTIIADSRGQPKFLTRSQAVITGKRRGLNNAFMDAEKQDAINV
ncbi:phosphatase [Lithospermum erythrorhizon]|uniref:Phosphatase n=1 Tax=Lithospermum erythrorhizon TaxID=34254 RepID=A0AAV3QB12_LITER